MLVKVDQRFFHDYFPSSLSLSIYFLELNRHFFPLYLLKEYFTQTIVLTSDDLLDRFIKQSVLKCVAQTVKTETIRELVNIELSLLFSDVQILQNDVQSCRSVIIHVVHVLNFEQFTIQSFLMTSEGNIVHNSYELLLWCSWKRVTST